MPKAQSPAAQLASFIAKFEPSLAARLRSCRAALRRRLPTAYELVYDNFNFFVIGYGPTPRATDAILSLVGSAKGVALCFTYGAALPDPKKVLMGGGTQTRFVRLESAKTLAQPAVKQLISAAIAKARAALPTSGRGELIIKSVSKKQRPRRKTAK